MKSIIAILVIALSSFAATATEAEGGTGLSRPGDYYNPDYKCSVKDGMTLYINVQPVFELSATVYSPRTGKVNTTFLDLYFHGQNETTRYYQIENALNDSDVGFLGMDSGISVYSTSGQLISVCQLMGHRIDEGPYYP